MTKTEKGYFCPKCGNVIHAKGTAQLKSLKMGNQRDRIYVFAGQTDDREIVTRECPECGNDEALHWYSGISGEHAGIGRERTVEHFRCTKCAHSWTKSS
jgi:DNA-directed RNA polymerase subunit M/transcription elongation factor TFIIS